MSEWHHFPLLVVAAAVASAPGALRAQDRSSAAVISATPAAREPELDAAVTRLLRSRAEALGALRVEATSDMRLGDVQFALGCVGESPECLLQVAEQLSVDRLLIQNVERVDDAIVLEVAVFDRVSREVRRATRRAEGERASAAILGEVDGALRELFDLPAPASPDSIETDEPAEANVAAPAEVPPRRAPRDAQGDSLPEPGDDGPSPIGFVTGGLGLATLGAAAVLAVVGGDAAQDFRSSPVTTPEEVDAARARLDEAQTFVITADVLFVAGAAMTGVGLLLALVLWDDGGDASVALAPTGGGVALVARGPLGGVSW
ncbi:MAG: hypothetical protein RLO52_35710 [Sandaracinaceae bacterium]